MTLRVFSHEKDIEERISSVAGKRPYTYLRMMLNLELFLLCGDERGAGDWCVTIRSLGLLAVRH